jgi:hypothetical protein
VIRFNEPWDAAEVMRRFQVGDLVRYTIGRRIGAPDGPYEVLACLPRDDHAPEYTYRIKCPGELTERVVSESHLASYN